MTNYQQLSILHRIVLQLFSPVKHLLAHLEEFHLCDRLMGPHSPEGSTVGPSIVSLTKPSLGRFPTLPLPLASFWYICHGVYFQ